jgi:hypothetical protein
MVMNGLTGRWRAFAGAVVALLSAGLMGSARAADAGLEGAVVEDAGGTDAYASLELDSSIDQDTLPLAQRYAPAPPRPRGYRMYRPYRPYWGYRIVPPRIFAPGWFGLYFLGAPPPPPQPAAPGVAPPPPVARPDFRHVNDYSLGVTAGAYTGRYGQGQRYADPGLRFSLDYRHSPVVGAQLSVGFYGSNMRLDGQGTNARSDVPVQLSAVLHAFPRAPIQPYFLFGGTGNIRTYEYVNRDGSLGDPYTELRVGPHAGIGLELLIADRASFVVEGRSIWYTLVDRNVADQTYQHDRSITGGVNFYF